MRMLSKIKSGFKNRVTILFIPHGKKNPFKVNISLIVLCVFMSSWTGMTICSGYIVGKHIDYAKTKTDNEIMKVRLLIFANQLERTKSTLKKIRINDERIRSLLALDIKKPIIEENLGQKLGEGGPIIAQSNTFASILSGKLNRINSADLAEQTSDLIEQYKFIDQSYGEIISHINNQKSIFMATPCGWPCEGRVSSSYGFRMHPIFLVRDFHTGLDIANELYTPVCCTANGTVIFSGWQSGYGNTIVIDHGHNYRTTYGHLSKRLANVGDFVSKGKIIAKMGSTGASSGSHLHYEIHFKGKSVNPTPYLTGYSIAKSNRSNNA